MTEQQYKYFKEGNYKIEKLQKDEINQLNNKIHYLNNDFKILKEKFELYTQFFDNIDQYECAKLYIHVNYKKIDITYDFPVEDYFKRLNEFKYDDYFWNVTRNTIIDEKLKYLKRDISDMVKNEMIESDYDNFDLYKHFYNITPKWLKDFIYMFYG